MFKIFETLFRLIGALESELGYEKPIVKITLSYKAWHSLNILAHRNPYSIHIQEKNGEVRIFGILIEKGEPEW